MLFSWRSTNIHVLESNSYKINLKVLKCKWTLHTTQQIPHSKLPHSIYDVLTKFNCPVDRLNLLCCNASWHLPFTEVSFVFGQFGESLTTQTWPAWRLRSRELEDTCTNADGWHEWKLTATVTITHVYKT